MNRAYVGRYQPDTGRFFLESDDGSYDRGGWQNIFAVELPKGVAPKDCLPLGGDWDGDGRDEVGLYHPPTGSFFLWGKNEPGPPWDAFSFGAPGWRPLAGDWDGVGHDSVGVYKPETGTFFLRRPAGNPYEFQFGAAGAGWLPFAGRWPGGPASDTVGLYDPASSTWYVRFAHAGGGHDRRFVFGNGRPGIAPVAGDFNGVGTDQVGHYYPYRSYPVPLPRQSDEYCAFFLKNDLSESNANRTVQTALRAGGMLACAGRWKPPAYAPKDGANTTPPSPDWAAGAVICCVNVSRLTPQGTFAAAAALASHFASVCDAVWVTPCHPTLPARPLPNYYDVVDHAAVAPELGGEKGLKDFVAALHAAGVKVLLDPAPHGAYYQGPLIRAHPDWFVREYGGVLVGPPDAPVWGANAEIEYAQPAVAAWWCDLMLDLVKRFDVDGFRCDLEPGVTGYEIWKRVRETAAAKLGKALFLVCEGLVPRRFGCYHATHRDTGIHCPDPGCPSFTEGGARLADWVADPARVETFYAAVLSVHDRADYGCKGRPVAAAYGALASPLGPVFFHAGEEWNATKRVPDPAMPLYHTAPDWTERNSPPNAAFLKRFQQLIKARRESRLFRAFRGSLNQSWVKTLPTAGSELPAYSVSDGAGTAVVLGRKEPTAGRVAASLGPAGTVARDLAAGDVAVLEW